MWGHRFLTSIKPHWCTRRCVAPCTVAYDMNLLCSLAHEPAGQHSPQRLDRPLLHRGTRCGPGRRALLTVPRGHPRSRRRAELSHIRGGSDHGGR